MSGDGVRSQGPRTLQLVGAGLGVKQEPAAFPLERREVAGAAHRVELELVAAVRIGAEDPLAADDVEGKKSAGPAGVDQIDRPAEPPFESVFEQQDLAERFFLPEQDPDVDVRLLGLLMPSAGAEQIDRHDPRIAGPEGAELAFDLVVDRALAAALSIRGKPTI
jgi:hypothetical protein